MHLITGNRRIFVTFVLALITLAGLGCEKKVDQATPNANSTAELVRQGDQKMREANAIRMELEARYHLSLHRLDLKSPRHISREFDWHRLTLSERNLVKVKLTEYVELVSGVLKIEAQDGIVVDRKDMVFRWWDNAIQHLHALRRFERVFGERYQPKRPNSGPAPVYNRS
ncbi:MAG: hypothetical protein AB7G93_19790 [Bdellovibrionales bacterium]